MESHSTQASRPLLNSKQKPPSYQSVESTEEKHLTQWELINMTICFAGLQFACNYGTPYLVSLGLSPELIALVWFAGPLSGFIIQPLVGAFSDKCTSRIGRRRPFIIIGGILVCLSMVSIAYSREWAAILLGKKISKAPLDDDDIRRMAIIIAVIGFYCLDFSLNAVQASIRALVLDIPPVHQQEAGNAWAGRMLHMGNIAGYFTGFLDLLVLFPFLGDNQLQVLCLIACIVFTLSLLYTCLTVKEKVYEPVENDSRAIRYLPSPIQKICNVQFFSWMGWFPFLFFSWIASVYARTHSTNDPDFFDKSTRYGSFALLMYSWISFVAGSLIPQITPTSSSSRNPFTIYNIYTISHIFFALIAWCTLFVNTVEQSICLIGSFGIPWAISMWVPFAMVGEYVQQEDENQIQENTEVRPLNNNDIEQDTSMNLELSSTSSAAPTSPTEGEGEKFAAGMILGVHNLYIVLPQLVVSLSSSVIIKLVNDFSHKDNIENSDAFGWVFRFGGIMAIIAAILSRYLDDLHIVRR
ncbi:178_t:CDS:2 [Dentiscutata erythropus]|uniref:178_t:CDS:1 n=1 Tax=Dentiscutata erythropus TaxID=1348616 RepID=A0A9N9B4I2_9GLOM|nr:178_t:CDS:2 [Dentiscutata erythropus]